MNEKEHEMSLLEKRSRLLQGGVIAGSLVLVLGASACAAPGSSAASAGGDAIKIAIVSDQTGVFAGIQGISGTNGALTFIDAVNAEGGVGGNTKIETTLYDGASTAGPAQTAARSALADEPDLILNTSGSVTTNAAFPLFEQSTVPVLSVTNTSVQVMPPRKYFWGFNSTTEQVSGYLQEQAKRLLGDLKGKRIAYEALQSPVGDEFLKAVQPALEAAGAITVDTIRVSGSITSFSSEAARIASKDVDLFIPIDGAGNMTTIGRALATAGYEGPILGGGDSLSDEAVFKALSNPNFHAARMYQPAVEGSKLQEAAKATGHDTSGSYFGSGYSIGQAAIAALEACGDNCDGEKLAAAIDGLGEFTPDGGSSSGPLLFGENRRAVAYSIASMVWDEKQGKAVQSGDLIQIENQAGKIK
jgi:branched-chain amino acid transport system substrate-binding protein